MRIRSALTAVASPAVIATVSVALTLAALGVLPVDAQQQSLRTIDPDELRPGMQGYGLTVFHGTVPERFDVEVIDVLHDYFPDQDLILIRTPHPTLNHTQSVAGMSGSPIYFDGRLAGAYAYGWQFGRDPIAGVTPIANMLHELDRPLRPDAFPGAPSLLPFGNRRRRAAAPRPTSRERLAGLRAYRPGDTVDPLARLASLAPPAVRGAARPIATPLFVGGLPPRTFAMLEEALEPLGVVPLQGAAGTNAAVDAETAPFRDGGAIGVSFARGDIHLGGSGTITHVDPRGRLVAFGHPMMNLGMPGLPTETVRVVHFLASERFSFRMSEAGGPHGTMIHDRQAAIVVDERRDADTIPLRVRLRGVEGAPRTEWNVEVTSHRMLTSVAVLAAMASALEVAAADMAEVSFEATSRVRFGDEAPIEVVDRGFSGAGIANRGVLANLRLFHLLDIGFGNPFETKLPSRIEIDLDVSYRNDIWRITEATTDAREVDPGAEIPVRVRFQRFEQPDVYRTIQVRIPERAAGESVRLTLAGGNSVSRRQPEARDTADLLRSLQNQFDNRDLVASLRMSSRGLRFPGHVAESLPRGALDALHRDTGTGPGRPFVTTLHQATPTQGLIVGDAQINLQVRERPRGR